MTNLKFQRRNIDELTVAYRVSVEERDVEFAIRWYDELQDAWKELQKLERVASLMQEIRPGGAALEGFLAADIDALYNVHLNRIVDAEVKTLKDLAALPKPPK